MTIGRGAAVTDPSEKPSRAVPGPGGPGVPGSGGPGVPGSGGPGVSGSGGLVGGASAALDRRIGPGGKLVVFGTGGASTDAQHIAVEFVHPVIVGKRALPAISLTCDAATVTGVAACEGLASIFSHQIRYLAEPADIALGIAPDPACPSVLAGLRAAREAGLLTIALAGGTGGAIAADGCADHLLTVGSVDPRIIKEIHVTTYHVLWELVHVFFEQPGALGPGVVS